MSSSQARYMKCESTRSEQEPIRNHHEPSRKQLEPRKNQPGISYLFQCMIFYGFDYTSRSIAFAYIAGIKEDFILLI